nr:protein phosphatase 2C domain-containing protein [Methylomarinum sp. Ch1-1]MDP4520084.1 protein phosphatase 2C domain-containing protein [Methylomarinum sp. Ch1-1]
MMEASPADDVLLTEPLGEQKTLVWRSQSAINRGKRRKLNEDALLDRPDKGLWVVADGMGGHQAGEVASHMIVEAMAEEQPGYDLEQSVERTMACLRQVNARLRQLAQSRYGDQIIGSTVVALIAGGDRLACIWAGDSRLYRLRERHLQQLTVDHSEDATPLAALSAGDMQSLKSNNVITRAVGAFDELELDCEYLSSRPGDKYLLCSDGVDKELSPVEIERILNQDNEDDAEALMGEVLARQARDNISIIVVEVSGKDSCLFQL